MADVTGVLVSVSATPTPAQLPGVIVNIPTALPTPVLVNAGNISAAPTPIVTPALNSFFDIAPMHGVKFLWLETIPLWALVGGAILLYWMWYNIGWLRKCSALGACSGYKEALMANSIMAQMNIVFTKSRKWFIRMLTYHSDGILYFKDLEKTDMWHMGASSAVGTMGGLSAVVTKDNFDEAVDPVADMALCTVCSDYNHGNFGDERNRARIKQQCLDIRFPLHSPILLSDGKKLEGDIGFVDAFRLGYIPQSISSYEDYIKVRPFLEVIWPDGIQIPGFGMLDPYASDKFTPKQRSPAEFGGNLIQDAYDYAEDNIPEPGFWEKNGAAMLFILGGLIILGGSFLATR